MQDSSSNNQPSIGTAPAVTPSTPPASDTPNPSVVSAPVTPSTTPPPGTASAFPTEAPSTSGFSSVPSDNTTPVPSVESGAVVSPEPQVGGPSFETGSGGKSNVVKVIGLLVLAILVIGGFAFGGYYLGTNNILLPLGKASPTPTETLSAVATPESTATPTPDPTAGWKAYNNTKYQFTLKRPTTLDEFDEKVAVVSGSLTTKPEFITTLADKSTFQEGTDAPFDGFSIYYIKSLGTLTFDKYIEAEVKAVKASARGLKDAKSTKVTIGGVDGYSITSETSITRFFVPTPDGKSVIVLSRSNKSTDFVSTFNQILATFKFTSATPTPKASASPTASASATPKAQ